MSLVAISGAPVLRASACSAPSLETSSPLYRNEAARYTDPGNNSAQLESSAENSLSIFSTYLRSIYEFGISKDGGGRTINI